VEDGLCAEDHEAAEDPENGDADEDFAETPAGAVGFGQDEGFVHGVTPCRVGASAPPLAFRPTRFCDEFAVIHRQKRQLRSERKLGRKAEALPQASPRRNVCGSGLTPSGIFEKLGIWYAPLRDRVPDRRKRLSHLCFIAGGGFKRNSRSGRRPGVES
jgi:hypothetical protein